MNFDEAFYRLMGHEGGYVNHPSDPGGETMWGITLRVARENGYRGEMKDMSQDTAKIIAKKKYWDAVQADSLPAAIRYPMFDAAYNSGHVQAIKWLQRALEIENDGVLGPQTKKALERENALELKMKIIGQRLLFLTKLSGWVAFGKGWSRRLADLLQT